MNVWNREMCECKLDIVHSQRYWAKKKNELIFDGILSRLRNLTIFFYLLHLTHYIYLINLFAVFLVVAKMIFFFIKSLVDLNVKLAMILHFWNLYSRKSISVFTVYGTLNSDTGWKVSLKFYNAVEWLGCDILFCCDLIHFCCIFEVVDFIVEIFYVRNFSP